MTTIMAAIIVIIWYARSGTDDTRVVQRMDEDLRAIHYDINLACSHSTLSDTIPLHIKGGELTVNNTEVCIRTPGSRTMITRCLYAPCDIPETTVALEGAIALSIDKTAESWTFTAKTP